MDTAKLIQVIETTLTRRGNGKDDPFRIITQYFSPDGTLLAERDPIGTILADDAPPTPVQHYPECICMKCQRKKYKTLQSVVKNTSLAPAIRRKAMDDLLNLLGPEMSQYLFDKIKGREGK